MCRSGNASTRYVGADRRNNSQDGDRSSMKLNKYMSNACVFSLLSVLVFNSALVPLRSGAQSPARDTGLVELTKTDLFSLPEWYKRTIAVDGFTLGISGSDASR